jgi:capping protein alpha
MTGEAEPVPTPATGEAPKEELEGAEGVEKLDEAIEEVKEEEETQAEATPEEEVQSIGEQPKVEEDTIKVQAVEPPAEASTPIEQKQQEKVDNPTYTLEVVGNRYNTSNFWSVACRPN